MNTSRFFTTCLILTAASSTSLHAEASGLLVGKLSGDSIMDQAWSAGTLYKDSEDPYVQEFSIIGQLQVQYASGSDDSGNYGSYDRADECTWGNTEVRRIRLGAKGKLFEKLTFLNLVDLYPDFSPRGYKRTPEMNMTYTQSQAFALSLGKTELKFDREQEYSSNDFLPFERSAVGNMVYGGELTGIWASGKGIAGGWLYYLGAFSNDRVDEFSHFDGGTILLGKIGYDYTKCTSLNLAEVKLQWLHNTDPGFKASRTDLASPNYSNGLSISNQITNGGLDLTTEFIWAEGETNRSDAYALSAMANYLFTPKLQLITTWEMAGSNGDNGIYLPVRYEAVNGTKTGDTYFAGYAGLNYYINGQKLKLMSGVKYSYLNGDTPADDFNGWTWLAGVRLSF